MSTLLVLVIFFVASSSAHAQEQAEGPSSPNQEIEEIVVTGSRIMRRDFDVPSPLATIDKAEIEFTPQATIEETLNQMPQVFPSFGRTSNNPSNGMANVDLRGLGPGRSLVLLNGRRLAPTGTGNEVDLNNIPRFLLQRIEIITGGTSTVYGSDAIAGVVNFITVSDFEGFGIEASFNTTEKSDAQSYDLSLAYGHSFDDGRGNVSVYANWFDRDPLFASERSFTSNLYVDGWDGDLYPWGSWSTPAGVVRWPQADLGNGPAPVTFNADGTPREFGGWDEVYNYAEVNYVQVPINRLALGAMGHYGFTDRIEGYFEVSFTRNEPALDLAPAPAWIDFEVNLDNPVLTPEARQLFTDFYACDANLACISYSKRFPEFGPRIAEFVHDYSRIVAGFRGELGEHWDIDGWVTYTDASSELFLRNSASYSRYLQGMLVDPLTNECYDPSGGCVPLDVFGEERLSAEAIEFLRYPYFTDKTRRTQKLASVYVTGSPLEIWAGPIDTAFGIDWRSDETNFKSDDAFLTGDVLGWGGEAPISGTEAVVEIYSEAVLPLFADKSWARRLELELGARYSQYERAGGVWSYKAGGIWQVLDGLQFRVMRQRSVRAPNSIELFEEQSVSYGRWIRDSFQDPCSASADPVGNNVAEKCIVQGLPEGQIGIFEATEDYVVESRSGGNPELQPEIGKTWTLGVVVKPAAVAGLAISLDYFSLEVKDTIGGVDSFLICFDPLNVENVFCDNIQRDASGNIARVTDIMSNKGLLDATGFDSVIQYTTDLPEWLAFKDNIADFSVALNLTHYLTHETQENPVTRVVDCIGYFGWPCGYLAYPKSRVTTNLNYTSGPLGMHLTWRWIEGTTNAAPMGWDVYPGSEDFILAIPEISDKHYLDFGLSYWFGDRVQLRLGVANLMGTDPPDMADQAWANNTDMGLYDVFGRSYYLTFSTQF